MSAILDLGPGKPVDPELLAEIGPRPLIPRRRPRPGTKYGPDDIAGLRLWLKADAIAGLADSDPIDSWANLGAAGGSFTSTTTQRPLYRTGQVNGYPAVDFDGVDDQMTSTLTLTNVITNSAFEYFVVFSADVINTNNTTTYSINDAVWGDAGKFCALYLRSAPQAHVLVNDGAEKKVDLTIVAATWTRIQARLESGTLYGSVGSGADSSTGSVGNITNVGNTLRLGIAGSGRLDGRIAELLIYNAVLTAAQRDVVKNYLAGKYGV